MLQQKRRETTLYSIMVRNRPGELARLTKFLSDAGLNVSCLRVANLGDRARIQFSAPAEFSLQDGLKKAGLSARVG